MWNQIFKFAAENARPFMQNVGKTAVNAGMKKGTQIAIAALVSLIIGALLGSHYQKKLFKEFLKTHDKETAECLTKECNDKIEEIKKQCARDRITDRQEIQNRLARVLRQYGVDPSAIFE